MPANGSHRESAVESSGYGAEQDRRDGLDGTFHDPKALRAQRQSSTGHKPQTITHDLTSETKPERSDAETSNSGGQSSDNPIHISDTAGTRRAIETAIWDWDTPLDSTGDSNSYYYEPQGELMQDSRDRALRSEFSIPHAVTASNSNWPFASGNDGFAVPRRVNSLAPSTTAGVKRKSTSDRDLLSGSQLAQKRASRTMSESGEEGQSPLEGRQPMQSGRSQNGTRGQSQSGAETGDGRRQHSISDLEVLRPPAPGGGGVKRTVAEASGSSLLPPRKVFPIQVGETLFRLSGASISSDGPSYFTQFFEEQLRQNEGADAIRTLYIDRDPATFADIALHLQGYHIEPRDGPHFVKLFADAQFFSLPRLTTQLFSSTIYIRIGEEEFMISRDLFSAPGDSPNYFSLGFSIFFSTPSDTFPGLSQRALLRPPSILPPSIPNRSAKIFSDLLHILKGYPVEIRNEEHRAALLRDARYFHLKGLEQRLIPHQISYNLARKKSEIVIRIEDIRQSGISFLADNAGPGGGGGGGGGGKDAVSTPNSPASSTADAAGAHVSPGWVYYQRPYVDSEAYSLVVEISGDESTFLSVAPRPSQQQLQQHQSQHHLQNPAALNRQPSGSGSGTSSPRRRPPPLPRPCRATFHRQTLSRITSLFSVIANKMNLPVNQPLGLMMEQRGAGVASLPVSPGNTGLSDEKVKVRIGPDADVTIDGRRWTLGSGSGSGGTGGGGPEGGGEEEGAGQGTAADESSSMEIDAGLLRRPLAPQVSRAQRPQQLEQEDDEGEEWVVRKAQYRIRVQPVGAGGGAGAGGVGRKAGTAPRAAAGGMEVILGAIKIEAYSSERGRNGSRGFLAA